MRYYRKFILFRYAIIFKLLRRIPWLKRLPILYISGSEILPPPLTNEEENNLLLRLEQGDTSVKSTLIERNLRLVVYIARKFENTRVGVEDLVSIGTIGLIKAVNTFDPSKRIKLATYASRCIENEILMYLRRNCKTKSEISFDEPLNIDWDATYHEADKLLKIVGLQESSRTLMFLDLRSAVALSISSTLRTTNALFSVLPVNA